MLNYGELKTATGELLERSDAAMATKLGSFLNDGLRFICGYRPWFALLRQSTFSSVAGLDYFITGPEVAEVIDLSQRETPIILALQRYYAVLHRHLDAISSTTGNPSMASPMGEIGIKAALPANGTITVESSSALDTTQYVRIHGYNASLLPITESILLTGTTAATSTNTYACKEGFEPHFTKDSVTTGTVTIKRSTTTIAEIPPTEKEVRYKKWKVWPTFQTSITMYLTYKKRIYKMSNAEDVPELECDNALIMFAFARSMQEKRQFAKAKEIYGVVDITGHYPPGSFMAELDALVAREPQFTENFTDQFIPTIERDAIDHAPGQTGYRVWPS